MPTFPRRKRGHRCTGKTKRVFMTVLPRRSFFTNGRGIRQRRVAILVLHTLWAPEEKKRTLILRDNPVSLYGF
jgi:hypothetical protein